jgi:hypothetical protein
MYRRLPSIITLAIARRYIQYSPWKTVRFAMIFPRSGYFLRPCRAPRSTGRKRGRSAQRPTRPSLSSWQLPRLLIDNANDDQRCQESRNYDRGNEPRCRSSRAVVARLAGEGLGSPTLVIRARNGSGVVVCLGIFSSLGHALQMGCIACNDQSGSRTRAGAGLDSGGARAMLMA